MKWAPLLLLVACRVEIDYVDDESVTQAVTVPPVAVEQCKSGPVFVAKVVPVMQSRCIVCHDGDGPGRPHFHMQVRDPADYGTTYARALTKLLPDDGGDIEANPILARPSGRLDGHAAILSVLEDDYAALQTWVRSERAKPCKTAPAPSP
jgi:hypothetical protein